MKDTMTVFSFCEWFRQSENRKNQFSFEGLKALYDYLTNMEYLPSLQIGRKVVSGW